MNNNSLDPRRVVAQAGPWNRNTIRMSDVINNKAFKEWHDQEYQKYLKIVERDYEGKPPEEKLRIEKMDEKFHMWIRGDSREFPYETISHFRKVCPESFGVEFQKRLQEIIKKAKNTVPFRGGQAGPWNQHAPEPSLGTCECGDPGCPVHDGKSSCDKPATQKLRGPDDGRGVYQIYCDGCAEDACDAGCLSDYDEDEDDE